MSNTNKSRPPSQEIEDKILGALLIIKSVDFLETECAAILNKIAKLENELEAAENFEEKEKIYAKLESHEPQLRQLIRRCEIERAILDKNYKSLV